MILIFDLDDTLYDERAYVESGLRVVALWGEEQFGWDAEASLRYMLGVLDDEGRGRIFDRWLDVHGMNRRGLVTECVKRYRHHDPSITLQPAHREMLERLGRAHPLYLVTDGHKIVQAKKTQALGIAPLFRRVFITHRFGRVHAKPSTHCFDLIRRAERCDWTDMVYVGDNPSKDFVNLTARGMLTVRVLTGVHRSMLARPGYDATRRIPDLLQLEQILGEIAAVNKSSRFQIPVVEF